MLLLRNSERTVVSCPKGYGEYRGYPPYLWIYCLSLRYHNISEKPYPNSKPGSIAVRNPEGSNAVNTTDSFVVRYHAAIQQQWRLIIYEVTHLMPGTVEIFIS